MPVPTRSPDHPDPAPLRARLQAREQELERAREALRVSEERHRLLLSNIPGAVYRRALDRDLTIEFVSPQIEEITGYPPGALGANRELAYAAVIHPDDRAQAAADMRAAVDGDGHYGLAYRIVRADGAEAWVGDRGQAVAGDDGIVWLYGTLSDITDRKRLEADRARMELELRMAQKLEAVGQLAAGIAHEINTPIQFIGDSVQFLREAVQDIDALLADYRAACAAVGDRDGDELRERIARADDDADLQYLQERMPPAFERTLDGVERVASIVRAMKEFAHPQTEQAPADLNRALASTLTVARSEYKYVAEVQTRFDELPPVVCNLSDVNQVFLNLIVNAAHAIEDRRTAAAGTAAPAPGTIVISTALQGEFAVVSVRDSGCGIRPDIRSRVFDPFFTTKGVGRGSGQGLAISRAVAERHGGSLTFRTDLGAGTTFTLRLPIAGVQPEPAPGTEAELRELPVRALAT
jgi:PAS domain S-box-containing protein